MIWRILNSNGKPVNPNGIQPTLNFFTPAQGQTLFTLNSTATSQGKPILFINGQEQRLGVDYIVNQKQLTWISQDFILSTTDRLDIYYPH